MTRTEQITLTAAEPSGLNLQSFPLTVGLPFRQGVLPADESVAILDGTGQSIPLQTRVMETHQDGSVRWLLLDYQSDLASLELVTHRLELGRTPPESRPDRRIEIQQQNQQLVITNGCIRIEVDQKTCQPLLKVWLGETLISQGGLDFIVTAEDGRVYRVCADSQCTFGFDERGPLRTVLRWDGRHKDESGRGHLDYCLRMTVYAGQQFARFDYTFINRLDPRISKVKSITARLSLDVGQTTRHQLADIEAVRADTLFETEQSTQAQQFDLQHVRFLDDQGELLKETSFLMEGKVESLGWGDVSGESAGALLAPKAYWQNYPKAMTVSSDAIEYHLIPDRSKPFEIHRGMAKTHTFFLQFHQGRQEAASRVEMARALNRWPMPAANSDYYCRSGEIWDIFPYDPKKCPQLEIAIRELFRMDNTVMPTDYTGKRPGKAYGLKHYGDFLSWSSEDWSLDPDARNTYYINNEYDTAHVYTMLFLRNHEVPQWWEAEAHALHCMDVDTCHHVVNKPEEYISPDLGFMESAQYRHCFGHIGSIQTPDGETHQGARGGHTFAEGLFDYYHLTGDSRTREVALATAIGMGRMAQFYDWGLDRNTGWGLLVIASGYAVEPHEDIRKGGQAMVDRLYDKLKLDEPGHEDVLAGLATGDRSVNLTMRGLIRWHQVTADSRTEKLILALMSSYLKHGFMEEGLPVAGTLPESRYPTMPVQGFANLESLAYTYRLTGDKEYIEAGIGLLFRAVNWLHNPDEDDYSNFKHRMLRGPFPFMAIAHELGILEKVPGAGGWLNP